MKGFAGRDRIEKFDAAEFNKAIACKGIEARRFRVENDFAYGMSALFQDADKNEAVHAPVRAPCKNPIPCRSRSALDAA